MKAGVIQLSVSPWATPIVLVPKKDSRVCFCVDYRKLNSKASFDTYPMPRVEKMFESVGSAQFISTLEIAKGYWQIPMKSFSKEKTAFVTPFGLYEFQVMCFGLHNAPVMFQRLMNHVLGGCQTYARAYIDDIVVYSQTWEEHLEHLGRVFQCPADANLRVKLSKCHLDTPRCTTWDMLLARGSSDQIKTKSHLLRTTAPALLRRMSGRSLDWWSTIAGSYHTLHQLLFHSLISQRRGSLIKLPGMQNVRVLLRSSRKLYCRSPTECC